MKCNKNGCQVCKNVIETDTFQSFVNKKVYKNVWSNSCRVRYVVCNIMVKLITSLDFGGIIIRITIRKVKGVKDINKQPQWFY